MDNQLSSQKTIQIKRTRRADHCLKSKDELISVVLQLTLSYGRASVERRTRTYLQQLCMDTGCSLEDLPEVMDDRDEWQENHGNSCEQHDTMIYIYIYIYICIKVCMYNYNNSVYRIVCIDAYLQMYFYYI